MVCQDLGLAIQENRSQETVEKAMKNNNKLRYKKASILHLLGTPSATVYARRCLAIPYYTKKTEKL